MKKLAAILLSLIFLLIACTKSSTKVSLDQLPGDYNLGDAKADNCVVFENNDITYGQPVWDDFISATENGKSTTVRLAYYYTLDDPSHYSKEYYEEIKDDYPAIYLKDLSFDGKKYFIESFEDGQPISKEYRYLLKYEGKPSSPTASFSKYTYYVLVNDNTVTWEDIEHGMISSQSGDWIDHSVVYYDLKFK
ncbi:MAG: hypothetical protein E7255_14770 [Lachnospiraceae bacterium]|nr:hypothetical protein [Lachnospiraceae bacterium]